ncbi:MAG TPA: hypothetical protein VIK68_08705, partial [Sphingomicrobium sp.]
ALDFHPLVAADARACDEPDVRSEGGAAGDTHRAPGTAAVPLRKPGGVSGLGTTVLAPAVANALYAATGKRMRSMPLDPMAVA